MIVVAGHLCLDIIPDLSGSPSGATLADILRPGQLVNVGPATLSTGGAVSNTGLALHRLGVPVRLMGKIGNDLFGQAIHALITQLSPELGEGLLVVPGETSSYTVIINTAGIDRTFLHCTGANDTFDAAATTALMRRVKERGVTTSLDMSMPDPNGEAGRVDWRRMLANTLPFVDLFCPSIDEIRFMLRRPVSPENDRVSVDELEAIAAELLDMGAAVVMLKLGNRGLFLRTTADAARLAACGAWQPIEPHRWQDQTLLTPCFDVDVRGTTGAGDCTIGGFLAALLHQQTPEAALTSAVGVGAHSVAAADATSGIRPWADIQLRIDMGWARLPLKIEGFDPSAWREVAPSVWGK
jgi:sugar/nucleoside kinase (ribokinase family)